MHSSQNIRHSYRPDIDGLRGIAVLLVVFFHAFPGHVSGGFVGVDVFFVISGFLISRIICHGIDAGEFSLTVFYAHRIRRILPALIIVLGAVFVAGTFLLLPSDLIRLGQEIAASGAFAANIYLWTQSGYFSPSADTHALLHLWSLGVEEQFYIIWPAFLILLGKRPNARLAVVIVIGLVSLALGVWMSDTPTAVFYFPATRAWELMIGAAIACVSLPPHPAGFHRYTSAAAPAIGVGCILLSAYYVADGITEPWRYALLPTAGAALVLWGGRTSVAGGNFLSSRALVWIGLVSYPLYLWHWPVLWVLRIVNLPIGQRTTGVIACVISGALAWFTYAVIEKPVRSAFNLRPTAIGTSLIAALVTLSIVSLLVLRNGLPGRWPHEVQRLLAYNFDARGEYREGHCLLYPAQDQTSFGQKCFNDPATTKKRLILWGDSAAAALYQGLRDTEPHFDIAELTASSCPPFLDGYEPSFNNPHCTTINSFVFSHIKKTMPDVVVLANSPGYPADIPKHMAATISAIKKIGVATIVVVGPWPFWKIALPEMLLRTYEKYPTVGIPDRIDISESERLKISKLDEAMRSVALDANVIYVSSFNILCNEIDCYSRVNDEPAMFDDFHLTKNSSRLLAQGISTAIFASSSLSK